MELTKEELETLLRAEYIRGLTDGQAEQNKRLKMYVDELEETMWNRGLKVSELQRDAN